MDEPPEKKDETKTKKRKGKNSASSCAVDDSDLLASGRANFIQVSASSSQAVGSPQPSLSNKLMSDTSPSSMLPKVLTTKKRKLEEMVRNNDLEDFQAEEESATSNWEHVEESYSRLNTERGVKFRCDLCLNNNVKKFCDREGDMKRHLQSSKHKPKSFSCPDRGCLKTFTRMDALKRHRNDCHVSSLNPSSLEARSIIIRNK